MKYNVLISIKPVYVKSILEGSKKYEYRKQIFKREVDKIYVYSSYPEQKIVGYFKYSGYKVDTPSEIWTQTSKFSGINKVEYDKYFESKDKAYAIEIDEFIRFDEYINPKEIFKNFIAPQSYKYLQEDID